MPQPHNEPAFRALYERYYDDMWRYASRRLPPDAVSGLLSDIFLVVWRRVLDVPPEPLTRAWLFTVARNCHHNYRRGQRRQLRLVGRLGATTPCADDVASDDAHTSVRSALGELPDRDQELLRLLYWEELSQAEVAGVLGISVNAVGIRAHRAKQRLITKLATTRKGTTPDGHEEVMQVNDE